MVRTAFAKPIFGALVVVSLAALMIGSVPMYAQQTSSGPAQTPEQPRLGPPPAMSDAEIQALTTRSGALAFTPRAVGQSRTDVVSLFNSQYTPALQVPAGWTGSVA